MITLLHHVNDLINMIFQFFYWMQQPWFSFMIKLKIDKINNDEDFRNRKHWEQCFHKQIQHVNDTLKHWYMTFECRLQIKINWEQQCVRPVSYQLCDMIIIRTKPQCWILLKCQCSTSSIFMFSSSCLWDSVT